DASLPKEGAWQFSVDGGKHWANIGDADVSPTNALLLDNAAMLRFVPAPDWNGTPGALSVHAVDDSYSGLFSRQGPGAPIEIQTLDTENPAPNTPVSLKPVPLITTVNPVNDPPVFPGEAVAIDIKGATGGP